MLARAGQPDAEQFLRAATKLKPTDKVDEGHARAWVSLGHVLEGRSPMRLSKHSGRAQRCNPRIQSRTFPPRCCSRDKRITSDAEKEYQAVLDA